MADHESIRKLAEALVTELTKSGKAVATAESCTGGWVAKAITDIPGSAVVFGYGVVCYANGAKESIIGVQNKTLEKHGAVSAADLSAARDPAMMVLPPELVELTATVACSTECHH